VEDAHEVAFEDGHEVASLNVEVHSKIDLASDAFQSEKYSVLWNEFSSSVVG